MRIISTALIGIFISMTAMGLELPKGNFTAKTGGVEKCRYSYDGKHFSSAFIEDGEMTEKCSTELSGPPHEQEGSLVIDNDQCQAVFNFNEHGKLSTANLIYLDGSDYYDVFCENWAPADGR